MSEQTTKSDSDFAVNLAVSISQRLITILVMASLFSLLAGCTPLKQYRTALPPYPQGQPNAPTNIIEQGRDYLLGFVEFDDHGWLWDPGQMKTVMDRVTNEDKTNGLLIIVFAHGWKHNASFEDGNVQAFRAVLSELQQLEVTNSAQSTAIKGGVARPPRKVVGIYLGWRGLSQSWWGAKELTFWERKRTAHGVGQGAVAEVLVELEEIRKRSRIEHKKEEDQYLRQPTMLVTVGHSFGGAVVYSAIAPLLQEHLIDVIDAEGKPKPPRGFGDLVVLVNPAFEAARFQVLKRSSDARPYITNQVATLAIFTSKADWATKIAFKVGRIFSTVFEKHRKDQPQYAANITAIGHYQPYITHDLKAVSRTNAEPPKTASPKVTSTAYTGHKTIKQSSDQVHIVRQKVRASKARPQGMPQPDQDPTLPFSESDLIPRVKLHKPHDPIYVVSVDKKIIPDHDNIETQAFITFLREFIFAFTTDLQTP